MTHSPVTLLILRHADAERKQPSQQDQDRPLSARGRIEAAQVAEEMRRQNLVPSWVHCSPAVRTRETYAIIQTRLGIGSSVRFEPGLYLADLPTLLRQLSSIPDTVSSALIIGHNPAIGGMACQLAGNGSADLQSKLAKEFPTAALAVISGESWKMLSQGAGMLVNYWTPATL